MLKNRSPSKPFNPVIQEGSVSSHSPLSWETVQTIKQDNLEAEITQATNKQGTVIHSFFFRQYKLSGFPTKYIALTPEDLKKLRLLIDALEAFHLENT